MMPKRIKEVEDQIDALSERDDLDLDQEIMLVSIRALDAIAMQLAAISRTLDLIRRSPFR